MGRFFQTAPTQFIDNYIYQPPWELMQQAAAQKQKVYDAAIASTKLFDNIPIEHLQGEDDVYNVQEKQRYYAENAANIAKAIQNDPSKAQQYLNNIDSLQKELQKDFTTGDISKIQGSAQAYKKWQEYYIQQAAEIPLTYRYEIMPINKRVKNFRIDYNAVADGWGIHLVELTSDTPKK